MITITEKQLREMVRNLHSKHLERIKENRKTGSIISKIPEIDNFWLWAKYTKEAGHVYVDSYISIRIKMTWGVYWLDIPIQYSGVAPIKYEDLAEIIEGIDFELV